MFYACKNQIKPKLYPLSCNTNTAHDHYCTADTTSKAPLHAKLNLLRTSASDKTAKLSA